MNPSNQKTKSKEIKGDLMLANVYIKIEFFDGTSKWFSANRAEEVFFDKLVKRFKKEIYEH